ncbi:phosphatidylserine decarboxylase [Leptospira inadai serovar Lyme str. 10]|uniref:Phosphatidylserine decarboxylase proenzyme n=2 Tax=Leptospira inadai serovar Lyme TaxID=293084 RepID=V6HAZ5_9LEPT|nr:archaetidylserine decarboxylase [Leptospira inadai]EQA36467.1 phosphatidylserine decarboxylase [Leptospira inadai serovar Lyme str. 10]PNV75748.1 phosphatidylserine decarboxylase [Leptospira inadai serovar Lyme]
MLATKLFPFLDLDLLKPYFYFLLFIGLYLTIRLRFPQIRFLFLAVKIFSGNMDYKGSRGRLIHSQAFFAGTGSSLLPGAVLGSGLALILAGPGVLLWIWISSFLIMPLRFVSSTLAIRFRIKLESGRYLSGPMYFIEKALRARWLAIAFSLAGLLTVLSMGGAIPMLGVSFIAQQGFDIQGMTVPVLISIIVVFVVLGGIRRIGRVAGYLAPVGLLLFFAGFFLLFGSQLTSFYSFLEVVAKDATSPITLLLGGGFSIARIFSTGTGMFFLSTETGIGKSAGVAGVVRTDHAAKQGLVSMLATFFEGFIVATLVIYALYSFGVRDLEGVLSFLRILVNGPTDLAHIAFFASFLMFAVVAIAGWFYTGEQNARYIFGEKFANAYRILFIVSILGSAYGYLKFGEEVLLQIFGIGFSLALVTAVPVLISLVLLVKVAQTELRKLIEGGAHYEIFKDFYLLLLSILPKNLVSLLFGLLAALRLPRYIMIPILKAFAKAYKINLDEAELGIREYNSLNQFFTRALKAGARIIDSDENALVSPVDAKVTGFGDIHEQVILQAKGVDYNLKELLGGEKYLSRFQNGKYITFYLSPQDYHRIHSPAYGRILGYYYEPGKLFPVNELAVFGIRGLFPKNERLITFLQTEYGLVAVIKVGASNVGRIRVTYDKKIVTNTLIRTPKEEEYKDVSIMIDKGAELGRFEMGSTVILILERDTFDFSDIPVNEKITYGTTVGHFRKKLLQLPR